MKSKKTSSKRPKNQLYTIQPNLILTLIPPIDVLQQPPVYNNSRDWNMNMAKVASISYAKSTQPEYTSP